MPSIFSTSKARKEAFRRLYGLAPSPATSVEQPEAASKSKKSKKS